MQNDTKIIQLKVDHVGRNDLRAMAVDQSIEFVVPGKGQMESARSTCGQMKLERMRFSCKFNVGEDYYSAIVKRLL